MKNHLHLFLTACFVLLGIQIGNAQNFISNADFELFSSSPVTQGQVTLATGWEQVVQSADYMNTTYNCWTPHIGGAYSGTGFMGFALYGTAVSACEAVGQNIAGNPLIPGTPYEMSIFSKMASGGTYAQICGGFALYGYSIPPPLNQIGVHPQTSMTAELLWSSPTITSTAWNNFTGNFVPTQTTNYLVMTIDPVPNCRQYIFIDSMVLTDVVVLDAELLSFESKQVYETVELEWEMDENMDVSSFTVEHGLDGLKFKPLEKVLVNEDENQLVYRLVHESPVSGSNFYRIKLNGEDGSFNYSEVLEENLTAGTQASIYPNPVKLGQPIYIPGYRNEFEVSFRLFDLTGKEVMRKTYEPEPGGAPHEINTENLLPGSYLYEISSGGGKAAGKVLIFR